MVIVAAIDGTDLDEAILQKAQSLSNAYDEPIHAVYVLSSDRFVQIEKENIKTAGHPADRTQIDEDVEKQISDIVLESSVTAKPVALLGEISDNIIRYADEQDARFIVIGLQKRTPTGKALFGSTSQKILLSANRPVVSIPTESF